MNLTKRGGWVAAVALLLAMTVASTIDHRPEQVRQVQNSCWPGEVCDGGTDIGTDIGPVPATVNTPCEYEDSVDCYWNAQEAGNGEGHSFIARQMPDGQVCILYVEADYAAAHDHCEAS